MTDVGPTVPDFPAEWSPPDRDPRPLTGNDLDMVDRYMGGGRVSEAQGDGEIRVFDLTAEIRRLRGANVDVYRLSELHGIVSSALNLLHEDLVDDGDRAEAWETAAEALTTELEPFLAGQPTGEPTEADPPTVHTDLRAALVDLHAPTHDIDEVREYLANSVEGLLDEIDELRALVGGRPAAPTHDEVEQAFAAAKLLTCCRECRDEAPPFATDITPADFIIWGKLTAPEGLGPKCWDHAVKYLGRDMPARSDQYAVVDLRPLRALLSRSAAEPPETCNGGDRPHPFEPGIDEDDPTNPDPRWCNTCGESRAKTGVAAGPQATPDQENDRG